MNETRLLALAGSLRRDSYNRKALVVLAQGAREAGAEVTTVDLRDFPMPIYDADWEAAQGLPGPARALQQLLHEHDGLLVASPEYNGFITPLLKNALDWASRTDPGASTPSGLAVMKGKVAGVVSASPGPFGGIRSLALARQYLTTLGFLVVPEQAAIGSAGRMFDESGALVDARLRAGVKAVGARVTQVASALAAARVGASRS